MGSYSTRQRVQRSLEQVVQPNSLLTPTECVCWLVSTISGMWCGVCKMGVGGKTDIALEHLGTRKTLHVNSLKQGTSL